MKNNSSFLTKNRGILIFFAVMLLMPFLFEFLRGRPGHDLGQPG